MVSVGWYNSKTKQSWWMGKCNSCDGVLLVLENGEKIFPNALPKTTDVRIPEVIRQDIHEAKTCYSVSAINAAVVMARRAIESICIDKGAKKGEKLVKQIEFLKDRGIITEDLKNLAHVVRYVGNDGAHAGDTVDRIDAEMILELAEQLATIIYVYPSMVNELKLRREQ